MCRTGTFDSHVCFAAHLPLRMSDGSARVYYMGGNGPHSGARNSSFALATLAPDRFAGVTSDAAAGTKVSAVSTRAVNISARFMTVTVDIEDQGGSLSVAVLPAAEGGGGGGDGAAGTGGGRSDVRGTITSSPITATGTDVIVSFPGTGLLGMIGEMRRLEVTLDGATLHTVGFTDTPHAA